MSIGAVETGSLVAFASIFTVIITKIKCYYKNPNCLCGYMDQADIITHDNVQLKVAKINDVDILYVSQKSASSDDSDDETIIIMNVLLGRHVINIKFN